MHTFHMCITEYTFFLEEQWLFEAITETYIPILKMFRNLEKDRIPVKLTMSITPPLMEMLANTDLQYKYEKRLEKLIELSRKVQRTEKRVSAQEQNGKILSARF